ncbi:hypothetical protein J4474_00555 [Candidatus Pacearchaeota archaeon]|nr:hypothetical protein [Candidatus Pacearchaeota archaeon]
MDTQIKFLSLGGSIPVVNRYDLIVNAICRRYEMELKWGQIEKARKTLSRIEGIANIAVKRTNPLCWDYIYSRQR